MRNAPECAIVRGHGAPGEADGRDEQSAALVEHGYSITWSARPSTDGGIAGHSWLNVGEPGHVAARSRKALNEAGADRIGNDGEDDGDGGRLSQQGRRSRCVMRQNEVGLQGDKLFLESLHHWRVGRRRPANVDADVATLCPPERREALAERCDAGLCSRVALGPQPH